MDQTALRSISLLGVKQTLTRLTRTVSRWTSRSDAAHDTPQDLVQLQTSMLVPSDARDQLAQSVQHREEPMVPEIVVHTFNSHCVQAMNK